MPTFKDHAYFSVSFLVLNDFNVRESCVINRHSKSQFSLEIKIILAFKCELNLKKYGCVIHG